MMTWKDAFKLGVMIAVGNALVSLAFRLVGFAISLMEALNAAPGVGVGG